MGKQLQLIWGRIIQDLPRDDSRSVLYCCTWSPTGKDYISLYGRGFKASILISCLVSESPELMQLFLVVSSQIHASPSQHCKQVFVTNIVMLHSISLLQRSRQHAILYPYSFIITYVIIMTRHYQLKRNRR